MPEEIAKDCSVDGTLALVAIEKALRSRGLNVHYTTWLRLIRTRGLPAVKVGGRYYIDLHSLDRWISSQSAVPPAAQPARAVPKAMGPGTAEAVLAARRMGGNGGRHCAERRHP